MVTVGSRVRGTVTLGPERDGASREVVASRCDDVARGLAFFATLALEELRAEQRARAEVTPAVVPPRAAAGPRPSAKWLASSRPATEPPRSPSLWGSVLVGQEGPTSIATLRYGGGALAWRASSHGPTIGLGAYAGASIPRPYGDGSLTHVKIWARASVCAFVVPLPARTTLAPCATFDGGVQRAALDGTAVGRAFVRPWLAPGAVLRLSAPVGRRASLDAGVGLVVPLLPFELATRAGLVFVTPPLGMRVELALGVPFF